MARSKHRFGVIAGGIERELFSVRTRPSGDLVLIRKGRRSFEIFGQRSVSISERYSFHPSARSDPKGSTVKLTLDLEDGRHIENSQFRYAGEQGFATVALGAQCTDLRYDEYTMTARSGGTRTLICREDVGADTLFFFVVASDYALDQTVLEESGLNVLSACFGHFWVTVLSGFFWVPAGPIGTTALPASGRLRVNEQQLDDIPGNAEPVDARDIAGYCLDTVAKFGDVTMRRIETHLGNKLTAPELASIRRRLSGFSKVPSGYVV